MRAGRLVGEQRCWLLCWKVCGSRSSHSCVYFARTSPLQLRHSRSSFQRSCLLQASWRCIRCFCSCQTSYVVWKLITLWVRLISDMPFLIVVATCLIRVQFYARKIGRQHSTCSWRDLCSWRCLVTVFYWTLSLQLFATLRSQLSMLTWNVVYWSVLHLILDSEWSGTAYCLSWRHLHWFDIEILY